MIDKKQYFPKYDDKNKIINELYKQYLINSVNNKDNLQFMYYNKDTHKDEYVKYNTKDKNRYYYHISIQPYFNKKTEEIKNIWNLVKNQYAYWRYGRKYPKLMNLNYDMAIEKKNNNHIHLIINSMNIEDMYMFLSFIYFKISEHWNKVSIYCKLCDTPKNAFLYDIKDNETEILTQNYFINKG